MVHMSMCLSKSPLGFMYLATFPEVIGYSDGFILKRQLVMGHKHHFHVYDSRKCDCYDIYLNRQFSRFGSVKCCPGELSPAVKFLCDAGQVIYNWRFVTGNCVILFCLTRLGCLTRKEQKSQALRNAPTDCRSLYEKKCPITYWDGKRSPQSLQRSPGIDWQVFIARCSTLLWAAVVNNIGGLSHVCGCVCDLLWKISCFEFIHTDSCRGLSREYHIAAFQ